MKLNIRIKTFIFIFTSIAVIYIIAFGLVLFQVNRIFTKNLITASTKLIKSSTLYFTSVFDKDIEILRSLKNTLIALQDEPYEQRISEQNKILSEVLYEAPQYLSIGVSWEMRFVLPDYKKDHGRFRYLYYIDKGKMVQKIDTLNVDEEAISSLYYLFKISKTDDITDIYYDTYTGRQEDTKLMNTIGLSILKDNTYIGLVAVDISLERLNDIVTKLKPNPVSQVVMVSHSGKVVANTNNRQFVNESFSKVLPKETVSRNLLIKIQNGENDFFEYKDSLGNKFFVFIEPFYFGNIKRAWSIVTIMPQSVIYNDVKSIRNTVLAFAFIGFFLMSIIVYFVINSLISPIKSVVESLKKISNFDISEKNKIENTRKDELGEINNSVNSLIDSLKVIKDFTNEISRGNLEGKIVPKSENDGLTQAIIDMQRSLKISSIEEDKRKEEEQISRWVVEGESKISEILRENLQNIEKLSYEIISYIVKYTNSAQGAIFLVNNKERQIELLAAYAYDRRKFLTKQIPFGVGLLGRAVIEGEMIYITDVPTGYTTISSGLGQEEPRTMLIVPFKFNEIIFALVELNSFKGYKPYIRNFIHKIGVSIASTIANLQITRETNKLVDELKHTTQDLTTQQEEMRQNIEEMKATQEEMRKKSFEYENIVNALNQVSYVITYNSDREIIDVNQNILTLLKRTREQMIGIKQGAFSVDENAQEDSDKLWKNIETGRITRYMQKVNIEGKIFKFSEAYIPIFDDAGKVYKVINIANDITNIE